MKESQLIQVKKGSKEVNNSSKNLAESSQKKL